MLVLLHVLEEALETFAQGNCDEARIAGICLQLRVDIPRRFAQYAEPTSAEADFIRYHRQLTALYGHVHALGSDIIARAVGDLLDYHEHLYNDLLDATEALPAFRAEKLKATVYETLPPVVEQIRDKQVPSLFLDELGYAVDALFTESKPPVLTYHHGSYLPDFIGMLRQLAYDDRPKDWPKRFVEALVNYNFNYMGFFNRWEEELAAAMEHAWDNGRADSVLRQYQHTINLYQCLPVAFDANRPSLKAMMEHTVGHLYQSLTVAESNSQPLRTSALAGDIAVRFRYRYKTGELDYDSQQEAAKDFVHTHLSASGQPVSAHTLTKFDKAALYGPALRYRRQLTRELELLEKDFNLNKTENR